MLQQKPSDTEPSHRTRQSGVHRTGQCPMRAPLKLLAQTLLMSLRVEVERLIVLQQRPAIGHGATPYAAPKHLARVGCSPSIQRDTEPRSMLITLPPLQIHLPCSEK